MVASAAKPDSVFCFCFFDYQIFYLMASTRSSPKSNIAHYYAGAEARAGAVVIYSNIVVASVVDC